MILPTGGSGNGLGEIISAQADYTVSLAVQKLTQNSADEEDGDVYSPSTTGETATSVQGTVAEARRIDQHLAALKESGAESQEAFDALFGMNSEIESLLGGAGSGDMTSIEGLLSGSENSLAQLLSEQPMNAYAVQANMKTLAVQSLLR